MTSLLPPEQTNGAIEFEKAAYYGLTPREAADLLQCDMQQGLSPAQVELRQQQYGPNELQEKASRGPWKIFYDQFTNIMLLMLVAVAVVSAVLALSAGEFPKDATAIFAIVLLNGILGFLQEHQAEKTLAALKQLAAPQVRVLRGGQFLDIPGQALVPGDIMLLEAGNHVAADGRLLEASNLQVQEAALTGEALPVLKVAETSLGIDVPLGDRINLLFQGTEVLQGRGKMLVTATGMRTELGTIANLLQSVETEGTLLQRRMTQLGNVLVGGSLVLVGLIVVGGMLFTPAQFSELLEVSLSMAVAVVPESLPAVITVTLALGMQRMLRRQALIRKLPAVETLGSVTAICSDKTGTLTQNKMMASMVYADGQILKVAGDGYSPVGEFQIDQTNQPINFPEVPMSGTLQLLFVACVVCNDAVLQKEKGIWSIWGDPTEGALLSLAGKANFFKHHWEGWLPRVSEFPFDSERKAMSVICQNSTEGVALTPYSSAESHAPYYLFVKGSPESLLSRCSCIQLGAKVLSLQVGEAEAVLHRNNELSRSGLRVLGLAYRPLKQLPAHDEQANHVEQNLIWLGLVGIMDPPRVAAMRAIAQCRRAGIRPVMITGDHQLTAQAIARQLDILRPNDEILTGTEIEQLSPKELAQKVKRVSVYARVAPEHKLRIVKAWQEQGDIVAMTGDGINDAPALKQADIGIAMGMGGTDVSKASADMVLLDDNFDSIVDAVEEGRIVYDNIRRFVKYVLGSNIGEIIAIAAAPLLGLAGAPLTPLQILWMNFVTDGLPAVAMGMEPGETNVMTRSPHHPQESIFARGLGLYMVRIGLVLGIVTIIQVVWSYSYTHSPTYGRDPETWKTMMFTTLCLAQMGHAIAIRSQTRLTFQLNPFSNLYLLAAVSLTTLLQLLLIYVPPLRSFFDTHWLSPMELLICLGFSALVFVWLECEKLVLHQLHRYRLRTNQLY